MPINHPSSQQVLSSRNTAFSTALYFTFLQHAKNVNFLYGFISIVFFNFYFNHFETFYTGKNHILSRKFRCLINQVLMKLFLPILTFKTDITLTSCSKNKQVIPLAGIFFVEVESTKFNWPN